MDEVCNVMKDQLNPSLTGAFDYYQGGLFNAVPLSIDENLDSGDIIQTKVSNNEDKTEEITFDFSETTGMRILDSIEEDNKLRAPSITNNTEIIEDLIRNLDSNSRANISPRSEEDSEQSSVFINDPFLSPIAQQDYIPNSSILDTVFETPPPEKIEKTELSIELIEPTRVKTAGKFTEPIIHLNIQPPIFRLPKGKNSQIKFERPLQKSSRKIANSSCGQSSLFVAAPENVIIQSDIEKIPNEATEKALSRFEKYGEVPNLNIAKETEHFLERNRVDAVVTGDYKEAGRLDELQKRFKKAVTISQIEDKKDEKLRELYNKIADSKYELKEVKKKWEEKVTKAKNKCYEILQQAEESQNEELEKFDNSWDDPSTIREFTKPSDQLIQLRKVEKKLILLKKYKKAEELKLRADKLEAIEAENNQKRGIAEMIARRENLIAKQDEARDCLAARLKASLNKVKKARDTEIETLEKRINKLESQAEAVKNSVTRPALIKEESPQTPRTTTRYVSFRNSCYFKPLSIKPIRSAQPAMRKKKKVVVSKKVVFDE